jgi:hypothetical protein
MRRQKIILYLNLTGEQVRFLECLSRKCNLNGGVRFSRSCILRCLIKIVSEPGTGFTGSDCEEKFFELLLEEISGME